MAAKVSNPGSATTHSSTAGRQNIFKYLSFEIEMVLLEDSRLLGYCIVSFGRYRSFEG